MRRLVLAEVRRAAPRAGVAVHHHRFALVLTELVVNAVRHGAGPVVVCVYRLPGGWVIDVEDGHAQAPPVHHGAEPTRCGRHGVLIVSRIADRWGWYRQGEGKHVWAQLSD